MNYRIIEKPAFTLIGKSIRVATADGENFTRIPAFWRESWDDGTLKLLSSLTAADNLFGDVLMGVCSDFAPNMEAFTYGIAAEASAGIAIQGLNTIAVAAATWAVFDSVGPLPDAIQTVWRQIMSDFFPAEPYLHGDGPEIEIYPQGDFNQSDYRCEVYIPVVAK